MRNRLPFTALLIAFTIGWGCVASSAVASPASKCVLREISNSAPSSGISNARVTAPVPGLYDSIPTQHEVVAGPIKIQTQYRNFANVISNGELVGQFARDYRATTKTFYFEGSLLQKGAPSFVSLPGVVPLVANRGVPTQALASLMLMKSFGVKYGGLSHAATNGIDNVQTILQMIRSPAYKKWLKEKPTPNPSRSVLEEALQGSHTLSYMETVLTQSGHKITQVRVNDAELKWISLRQLLLMHQNAKDDAVGALLFDRDSHGNLTKLSLDQLVPVHFAVEMDLAPYAQ